MVSLRSEQIQVGAGSGMLGHSPTPLTDQPESEPSMTSPSTRIEFVRLTEVPLSAVMALLNEPRNARHMPLAGEFDQSSAAEWVQGKDSQWQRHGYGPWAVLIDDDFAGWAGFQQEESGADFALVLLPRMWGHGAEVARTALDRGFDEFGLDAVVIALPLTRSPTRAVARFGFVPDGDVTYGGSRFRQYRLTRRGWAAMNTVAT